MQRIFTGGYFWPVTTAVLVSALGAATTTVGRRRNINPQQKRNVP